MTDKTNKRRIRIVHDGGLSAVDMRVTDAETEEPIRYVRRVELTADARDTVQAVIYLVAPELDVTVDAEVRMGEPPTNIVTQEIVDRVVAQIKNELIAWKISIEEQTAAQLKPFIHEEDRIANAIDRAVERKIAAAEKAWREGSPPRVFLEGNGE